jgi:hypothetical protein
MAYQILVPVLLQARWKCAGQVEGSGLSGGVRPNRANGETLGVSHIGGPWLQVSLNLMCHGIATSPGANNFLLGIEGFLSRPSCKTAENSHSALFNKETGDVGQQSGGQQGAQGQHIEHQTT